MNNIEWYLHAMPRVVKYGGAKFFLTLQCQEDGYSATYESVTDLFESHVLILDPLNLRAIMANFDYDPCRALEGLYNFYNQHKDRLEVIYPSPTRWRDAEEVPMHKDATIIVAWDNGRNNKEVNLSDLRDYDSWGEFTEAYGVTEWRYKDDPLNAQGDEQEAI